MLDFNASWFRWIPTAHHLVQVFFKDGSSIVIVEHSGEICPDAWKLWAVTL
jgi:hypothetical protein